MSGRAIRETLAALGVIASMVFVGMEIRQSNIQARAAAYQEIGIATAAAFDAMSHDREFLNRTRRPAEEMDAADWMQFGNKVTTFARLGETVLLQIEQGLLDEDAMARLGYIGWSGILDQPKYACVWPLIRTGVSESFRQYVEEGRGPSSVDCTGYSLPEEL